jgi:hypothetical protein
MNEMELLRDLGAETPLPAPADLDAARARLAAIAADPAGRVPAAAETARSQPDQSSDQPAGPRPPAAPAPVRSAVKLMWGGATGTAVQLIIALFYPGDIRAYHLTVLGHHLTTAQLSHWRPLIATLAITVGLVEIALWLWAARAAGRARTGRASCPRCWPSWRRCNWAASMARGSVLRGTDLADRRGRGVAALAPVGYHVLQATGPRR